MEDKSKDKVVFPDLSYKIIGATFKVFNYLGWGFSEKHYQRALEKEFSDTNIDYKREVHIPLNYSNFKIGHYFADFLIEDKIILELKVVPKLGYSNVKQVLGYLMSCGIKLGILIYFTKDGVKYRRVLNPNV